MGAERQVISGDAWLESREDEDLAVGTDLENGSAAVADIKILPAVEGNPGRDTHAFGIGGHGPVRRDPVYGSIKARRNVHLSGTVKGNRGSIHQSRDEGLDVVVGIDLVDGNWNLLSARPEKVT